MFLEHFKNYLQNDYYSKPLDSIFGISAALWGVIATLIVAIIALFGDQIKNRLFRPNIQPVEPVKTPQIYNNATVIYHRLIVKNARKASWFFWFPNQAKDARVLLTYRKLPKQNSFIPIPLRWTHFNTITRDIPPGEEVYIDIFGKVEGEQKYRFSWAPGVGPGGEELDYYNPQYGDIRLVFFEQHQKIGDIYLGFDSEKDTLVIK